jgi:hypothetical protein
MITEEKRRKLALAAARSQIRAAIMRGNMERATALCLRHNLVLNDCMLDAVYGAPEVVTKKESHVGDPPVAAHAIVLQTVEDPPRRDPSGWPQTCTVEVYSKPINPRLTGIILPDGRKSLLWKTRNHSIGSKVAVKFREAVGEDSYYEEA